MSSTQMTTFYLNEDLFGIPVDNIQEVTGEMSVTATPLAPGFVVGLINLRGQIATAIDLKKFIKFENADSKKSMSFVCKIDGNLMAFFVDTIGDVIDVDEKQFEQSPETLSAAMKSVLKGVYKTRSGILSCLDIDKIKNEIFYKIENK